jgi:hypothetical protein
MVLKSLFFWGFWLDETFVPVPAEAGCERRAAAGEAGAEQ